MRTDIWAKGEKERDIDHTLARGLESKQASWLTAERVDGIKGWRAGRG